MAIVAGQINKTPLKGRAEYKRSVIEHGLDSEFVADALAHHRKLVSLLTAHQMARDLRELGGKVDVFTVPNLCPLDVSPCVFSHADQLIEQAAEHTRQWIEGGGMSRPEIPNSLLPHSH